MKIIRALVVLLFVSLICSEAFAGNENFDKAVRYYLKKDYKNAAVFLKKYVAQAPDPAGYYMLGYASYKLKKFDESNRYFSEAYLIDPNISARAIRPLRGN